MSAFDAGAIRGSLNLDTTNFKGGFSEAHTHAETEGGAIREVLESLAEVMSEVVGPQLAMFGQQLQSAFAGFSEGPAIGALNLLGIAAGTVREAVEGAGAKFHQMGLEAEKAGVSADFLSRLAAVGGTVGLSLEQLGNGFKILEQQIEGAQDGSNTKAIEGFKSLGISIRHAGELSKDPEKLFAVIQDRLGQIEDASKRTAIAHEVLGRAGYNLVPIFKMTRDEFGSTADAMQRLGGTVSDQDVVMGEAMGRLEGYFGAAMLGIERALAKPVLGYLQDHMQQIEPEIESLVTKLVTGVEQAWSFVHQAFSTGVEVFNETKTAVTGFAEAVRTDAVGAFNEFRPLIDAVADHFRQIIPILEQGAVALYQLALPINQELLGAVKAVAQAVANEFGVSWKGVIPLLADATRAATEVAVVISRSVVTALQNLQPFAVATAAVMGELGQVIMSVAVPAFHRLEAVLMAVYEANKVVYSILGGPIGEAIQIVSAEFRIMGDVVDWLSDKVSKLISMFEGLAGIGNLGLGLSLGGSGASGGGGGYGNPGGIAQPQGTEKVLSAMAPASDELTSAMLGFLNSVTSNNRNAAAASAEGSPVSPGRETKQGTAVSPITVNVSTNFDPHTTSRQIAERILPHLQRQQQRAKQSSDGVAQLVMARMAMGGE